MISILKPSPFAEPIQEPARIQEEYRHWRFRVCYSIFIGYAIFYFTRKSFTFAMPFLSEDLGYSKGDLGILASTLYIAYGISKFASGVMCDRSNPRYFMAIGLMMTGVLNILFGFSSSLWLLTLLWGLNGWFQAWGWPAATKLLTNWYAQSERGLWYSFCSTSHNVGGALIPILAVYCAGHFGWRYAMFVPGVISIVLGFFLINRLRDIPQTLGLPPIEEFKDPHNSKNKSAQSSKQVILKVSDILFKQVLNNKYIWVLSVSYFFVYVVRTALNDWGAWYLMDIKGYEKVAAAWGITWFEIGGIVGMLIAGWASDYFFRSKRVPSMVICAIGMIASVYLIWSTPIASVYLDYLYFAALGMFVFGPQMLAGLAAAELVDGGAASASNGFVGTLGYFGAAAAGYPIGKITDLWGWSGFFFSLVVCSVIVMALLFPLWQVKRPVVATAEQPA